MLTRTKRTVIILGASVALVLGGGIALAASDASQQPDGPTFLCVDKAGVTKYVQFRRDGAGNPPACNRGLHQWKLGAQGAPGQDGQDGAPGRDGQDGADGVSGYEVLAPEQRYTTGSHTMTVTCPEGKVVLGGGYGISAQRGEGGTTVEASQVDPASLTENEDGTWVGTAWQVQFTVHGTQANMKTTATCAATS